MAHFTLPVAPSGPIINATIGVSISRAKALESAGIPVPPGVQIRALIDTGASCTCVDPAVMVSLGLTPTGLSPMVTPSTGATPVMKAQYDVSLGIPPAGPNHLPYIIGTLAITECELANQGIQALIGRDILADCLLSYNGTMGFFTLAF